MNAISLFIPLNSKICVSGRYPRNPVPDKNWLATQTRELNTPGVQGDRSISFSAPEIVHVSAPAGDYYCRGSPCGKEAQTLFQAMKLPCDVFTLHPEKCQLAINLSTHEPINVPSVMFTALDFVANQAVYSFGSIRLRRCSAIHEISVDDQGIIIPVKLMNGISN